MTRDETPRVLVIAQWPHIKNAEYELAERIRRTGYKVTVVDFLGMDPATGRSVNGANLPDEFDFALSFHYETPKFLNLPTFLWVANPLEFIHAQGSYRTHLIHNLRAYDDYLYNGSDLLKAHIASLVGTDWSDSGLGFYQSCSRTAILPPPAPEELAAQGRALFYCGVNWEAISDKEGRAQGLLDTLQARGLADFYGPKTILGVDVWSPFRSYRGEIPFDGVSMFPAMNAYRAVLAVSSPAHMKSRTSSGRAMEGFAAGVPVISDENAHVRSQFGDIPYYYSGGSAVEQADSIQASLEDIRSRPREAVERVRAAQELLSQKYCFEVCLEKARDEARRLKANPAPSRRARAASQVLVDVFLFAHDPYDPERKATLEFGNVAHILRAMAGVPREDRVRFRLLHQGGIEQPVDAAAGADVEWIDLDDQAGAADWHRMRLGEKVARLSALSKGDFCVFLTQSDFPHHDYFAKALEWLSKRAATGVGGLHVAGFYASDLSAAAPLSAGGIVRNSASQGLHRWTQDSIAQHALAQLCFDREALKTLDVDRLRRFDVLFAVAAVLGCMAKGAQIERSRHLLVRTAHCYYHRYYEAFKRVEGKGLWAQHYELLSNASHEINGLYDVFHADRELVRIADRLLGIDLPPQLPPATVPVAQLDPNLQRAVLQVSHFLNRISPYVMKMKRVARMLGIKS